jgi:hypothetical protein
MRDEIVFPRSKRTMAMVLALFLLVQGLVGIFQIGWVLSGAWMDAAIVELVLVGLCVGLLYPFVNQRYVRFFPDGISYFRFFRRRFLAWGEINAISKSSLNQVPVLRLAGDSNRLDIILGEYLNGNEVVKFIDQRLNAVNDPRRKSLKAGILQHVLAGDDARAETNENSGSHERVS